MRRLAVAVALLCAGCTYGAAPDKRVDYVLFFDGQSTALDGAASATIHRAVGAAERTPKARLVVAGYADDPGAPEADQIQSRLRAQAVADALVAGGVARRRIEIEPRRALGGDPARESRRVEIRLDPA